MCTRFPWTTSVLTLKLVKATRVPSPSPQSEISNSGPGLELEEIALGAEKSRWQSSLTTVARNACVPICTVCVPQILIHSSVLDWKRFQSNLAQCILFTISTIQSIQLCSCSKEVSVPEEHSPPVLLMIHCLTSATSPYTPMFWVPLRLQTSPCDRIP